MSHPTQHSMLSTPPPLPMRPALAEGSDTPSDSILAYRARSDTILTDSSASSLPSSILQTPQTPSILGVLASSPDGPDGPDGAQDHIVRKSSYGTTRRKLSYGFGSTSSIPTMTSPTPSGLSRQGAQTPPALSSPPHALTSGSEETEIASRGGPINSSSLASSTPGTMDLDAVSAHLAEFPFPLASPLPPPSVDDPPPPSGIGLRTRSFKQLVRRKIDRSRSSLRSLTLSRGRSGLDESDGEGEDDAREEGGSRGGGKARRRLRSLISLSLSRSGSSLSLRSSTSVSTTSTLPSALPSASAFGSATLGNTSTTASPSAPTTAPASPLSSVTTSAGASRSYPPLAPALDLIDETHVDLPTIRTKGKSRAKRSTHPRPTPLRPALPTSTSTSLTPVSAKQGIIARPPPRSVSSPLPRTPPQDGSPPARSDLFDTMLPRELRVLVLRSLLALWDAEPGNDRWSGEIGGRRELIKLSRVSKSWRLLCLDGQLWSTVDLGPFATVLHPATFTRIVKTTAPFITSLSVRGMDALRGSVLLDSLGEATLPSLTAIDLRGCKRVSESQLIDLVVLAPNVRVLNLKGVQSTTAAVLRLIAETSLQLESLDVSRCWDLSLADLAVFLRRLTPEQAGRYKVLRVAGLKAYGPTASDLLPTIAATMPLLHTLDLGGCTRIRDEDWRRWRKVHDAQASTSPLEHLNISGCTELTTRTLEHLTDTVPLLLSFEMASVPEMFRHAADNQHAHEPLEALLRSVPRLEKLDLEGTGQYGGINDRVLRALIPAVQGQGGVTVTRQQGGRLREIRLGFAKHVLAAELIHLIRGLEHLQVLEVDNTMANDAVMREFHHRRLDPCASISLVDCLAVSPTAYFDLASSSRPRMGFTGHAAVPFAYEPCETGSSGRGVVKTFWSWKRVVPPKLWREALAEAEDQRGEGREEGAGSRRSASTAWSGVSGVGGGESQGGGGARGMRRRGSWWNGDRDEDDDRGCVVM